MKSISQTFNNPNPIAPSKQKNKSLKSRISLNNQQEEATILQEKIVKIRILKELRRDQAKFQSIIVRRARKKAMLKIS
jgi:hypothetical protein